MQTDASAVGLGAVLEQDGHVIAYASPNGARASVLCDTARMSANSVCLETVTSFRSDQGCNQGLIDPPKAGRGHATFIGPSQTAKC